MRNDRLVRLVLGTWVLPLALSVGVATASNVQSLQVAIGPWTLVDQDLRDGLGTGICLDFAYASQLSSQRGPWLEITAGYQRAAGPLGEPDPTFEVEDTVLELIPFSVGVRNRAGTDQDGPIGVYLGAGATWALERWSPAGSDTESSSTFGGYVELRPDIRVREGIHVWLRQRFHLLTDSRFGSLSEVNPSGLSFSFGLGFDLPGGAR